MGEGQQRRSRRQLPELSALKRATASLGRPGQQGALPGDIAAWLSVLESQLPSMDAFEVSWLMSSCGKLLGSRHVGSHRGLKPRCMAVQQAAVRLLTANREAGRGLTCQDFNAIDAAQALMGLANAGHLPDEQFRESMEGAVAEHCRRRSFSARDAANVLWAAAKLHWALPPAVLQALVGVVIRLADRTVPQDVSITLWALGTMAEGGMQVPVDGGQQQRLVDAAAGLAESAKPQDVSNVLLGLAKLGQADSLRTESWGHLVTDVVSKCADANSQHLSNSLWALAKVADSGVQIPIEDWQQQLLVDAFVGMAARAKPQEVSNVLWALAKLGRAAALHPGSWEDQLVGEIVAKSAVAKPQALANAAWALAKLAEDGVQVLVGSGQQQQLQQLVDAFVGMAGAATPQNVSNVLWAVAKLGHVAVLHPATWEQLMAAAVAKRADAQARHLANALWAAAKVAEDGVQEPIDGGQQQLLVDAVMGMAGACKPQDVSNVLWAVAKLGCAPALRPGSWDRLVAILLAHVTEAETQALSNALWALARLAEDGVHVQQGSRVVQALVDEFGQRRDAVEMNWNQVQWAAPWLGVNPPAALQ